MSVLSFADVRKGNWVLDRYGQLAIVISKTATETRTKRYEYGEFWNDHACWSEESWRGYHFTRVRAPRSKAAMAFVKDLK